MAQDANKGQCELRYKFGKWRVLLDGVGFARRLIDRGDGEASINFITEWINERQNERQGMRAEDKGRIRG